MVPQPDSRSFGARYGRLLRRHDLRRTVPAASPWHGLLLGNGDMGAVVFGPEHALHFRLNKLDLWDARWPETRGAEVLPLSQFLAVAREESVGLADGQRIERFDVLPWTGATVPYPCLRTGADLVVSVSPLTGPTSPTQRLRLRDATYQCRWTFRHWRDMRIEAEAFLCYDRHVLVLRLQALEEADRFLCVSLRRDPWGGRTDDMLRHGEWGLRDWRDPRSGMLPAPTCRAEGPLAVLTQEIPGDADTETCLYAVAAWSEAGAEFALGPGGEPILDQPCRQRSPAVLYVALATQREGADPVDRAIDRVRQAAREGYRRLHRAHAAAWQRLWSANRVELSDRPLERQWYRGTYLLACHARPGGPAPGLFGVGLPYDAPPWRGDRHNNWPEYAGLFWGAFVSNHLEIARHYTEHVERFLPTARRIAREVFECPEGAAFPHVYIDYTRRYYFDNLWSRSLYLTAITVQNCWWHYLYSQDRTYLAEHGYPILREAADFYVSLVAKNPPGDYSLGPTVPPEYRGFLKDLALSRNSLIDLALVKFLLRAVIQASRILQQDADRRSRWQDLLDHLPPYPTLEHEGRRLFADVEGNTRIPPYNHPVGVAPLFPGEDPDCFGAGRWREVAEATLRWRDWGDFQMIAYARLGDRARAFELAGGGQPFRQGEDANITYAASAKVLHNVGELLLSSWDGTIRVFPAWPLDRPARFEHLRAVGAFLVSAACADGRVGPIDLWSEAGAPACVQRPWPQARVVEADGGSPVPLTIGPDGTIRFETRPGTAYRIEPVA